MSDYREVAVVTEITAKIAELIAQIRADNGSEKLERRCLPILSCLICGVETYG